MICLLYVQYAIAVMRWSSGKQSNAILSLYDRFDAQFGTVQCAVSLFDKLESQFLTHQAASDIPESGHNDMQWHLIGQVKDAKGQLKYDALARGWVSVLLMGSFNSCVCDSKLTLRKLSKHKATDRVLTQFQPTFCSIPVCTAMFLFGFSCSKKVFKSVRGESDVYERQSRLVQRNLVIWLNRQNKVKADCYNGILSFGSTEKNNVKADWYKGILSFGSTDKTTSQQIGTTESRHLALQTKQRQSRLVQ